MTDIREMLNSKKEKIMKEKFIRKQDIIVVGKLDDNVKKEKDTLNKELNEFNNKVKNAKKKKRLHFYITILILLVSGIIDFILYSISTDICVRILIIFFEVALFIFFGRLSMKYDYYVRNECSYISNYNARIILLDKLLNFQKLYNLNSAKITSISLDKHTGATITYIFKDKEEWIEDELSMPFRLKECYDVYDKNFNKIVIDYDKFEITKYVAENELLRYNEIFSKYQVVSE